MGGRMLNYIEQIERERRRRTLRKLARNCGSVKQPRMMVMLAMLSPDNRTLFQKAMVYPLFQAVCREISKNVGARGTVREEQLGTIHRAPTENETGPEVV